MSAPASSPVTTDRNLLFGILALQMDFINRDALVAAMNAWVLQKATPLGQILLNQGAIEADTQALLDALVRKHLEMHGGDAQQSLAAVSPLGAVREQLERIADPDLYATLGHVSSTRNGSESDPFATRAPVPDDATLPNPRFRILRPHARGGLGEVFVARDTELHREVALKEIQGRYADNPDSRARFLREAEITGGLEHPGIVPVYGLGQYADGRPFYAMRFIRGDSLQAAIARFHRADTPGRDAGERTLSLRQLLARFLDVCNAIAYAHSRGVLHRDLKPGNVMLGKYGETLVVDWGLAKPLGRPEGTTETIQGPLQPSSASGSAATQMGSAIGTPAYMPPEQAAGRLDQLGPASDVYSLGATLYCLLTGVAPFEGRDPTVLLRQVQRGEFRSPRQVKSTVAAALQAVCLKAMALRPEDRYTSPRALAEDIEHWLADEPVGAWREPWGVKARRWVGRHRTLVTAGAATLGVATVSLTVAMLLLHASNTRERQANADKEAARQGEKIHAEAEGAAKREAQKAHRDAQRELIDLSGASGLTAARDGDHSLALLWCARAVQLARDEPDLQKLNRIRVANWFRHVWRPQARLDVPGFQRYQDRFRTFQFSPDGNYLLTITSAGECLVWDCRQGRPLSLPASATKSIAAAWEPKDGLLAVAGKDGQIQLLSPPAFQPAEELTASGDVSVLTFSRDGQRLAWGGAPGARVWDRGKKEYISPLLNHPSPVVTLSFSASGQLLATSASDAKARVFRIGSGESEPLFLPVVHSRSEHGLAHGGPDKVAPKFTADDQILLTVETIAQGRHRLVWRAARTGKFLTSSGPPAEQDFLTAFTVHPRGDQVAVMWEDNGQLWDTRTQQLLATISLDNHYSWCEDIIFAADGKTLITGAHNMRAQFWSAENRSNGFLAAAAPPVQLPNKVVRVTLAPDGSHLAIALWDGTISLWRRPSGPSLAYSLSTEGTTLPVLSPDGGFVLGGGTTYKNGTQRTTRVYRAETGQAAGPVLDPGGILLNTVFSPDGTQVATASSTGRTIRERQGRLFEPDGKGGNIQIWDWKTGKRRIEPIATPSEPRGLAFRPDGKTLAAVCADYRVVLIDPRRGVITHHLDPKVHTRPFIANLWWGNGEARFSPDGRFLVTWEMARPVHVWDPDTGRLLHTLPHNERVESVAFSPTAPAVLATAGRDSVVYVWDLDSGRKLARLQHPVHTSRVRFGPDGTELITSCADGMLRVWDWRSGKLKDGLALHPSGIVDFAFTADRRWLVTLGLKELQLTDWQRKTPAGPLWPLGKHIHLALCIPAGERQVLVAGFSGSLAAYDLKAMTPPVKEAVEDLVPLAELAAGRRILETGQVVPLDSSEWGKHWLRLQQGVDPK